MGKKASIRKKTQAPKVSYHYKPEHLSLEQWQIALRQQAAEKEAFVISEDKTTDAPGYYTVKNPITRNEYRVVFRGKESLWNYCSCMDFKTSRLGTCKHIEAVKMWIKAHRKRIHRERPAYSSLYLSYRGKRQVCLRIGTNNEDEFRKLAEPYFTPDGVMRPGTENHIFDFLTAATRLDDTFRWYPDALNYIVEQRDQKTRTSVIQSISDQELDTLLKVSLYAYQKEGIRFAYRAGKSIIADEMGLGKTIQAIGTAELMKKNKLIGSVLIVCPTSLKYQWKKEIEKFTDSTAIVIEGNHFQRKKMYEASEFYKIVSYNSMSNDVKILRSLHTDFLIMDEVQRLKNWKTQISQSARHIDADYAVVLSGTPLENKLEELYSVMQFVDQYCLGPYYQFMDQAVITNETGKVIAYKNLNEVGKRLESVLIRRRKRDVALQLPERQDKILFVPLTTEQRDMHDEYQAQVSQLVLKWNRNRFLSEKDRKRLLLFLSEMRMVCDSTYILDQKSRYDTKVEETMNILRNVFDNGDEKVVIFSQWERMTRLIAAELDKIGVQYEYLHGGVPSEKRKDLMLNFTENPASRVFISTDAGSTGLNLQVASILINIDLPWNPAVLEQRIARIYRLGQQRNIQVINMVASQTIEERMLSTLNFKSSLFEGILDNGADSIFLEDSKLDKIMDSIKDVVETVDDKKQESASGISTDDMEENVVSTPDDSLLLNGKEQLLPFEDFSSECDEERTKRQETKEEPHPQELLQQGISFFNGLAKTLQSPEATKQLVDAIVKVDEQTGETSLHIPVPNKDSVANVLSMLGKLFEGK